MYSDEELWRRKRRYQRERNKQIGVYNEGFKHLSVSFGVFS